MNLIISLISGLIFSFGLSISGMINPQKVIGFLDVFGTWDASLVFVMLGATGFNFIAFKIISKRASPFCAIDYQLPTKKLLDRKLFIGSAIFGIGWGIAGICPGPGLVNIVSLNPNIFIFIGSMSVGMNIFKYAEPLIDKRLK